MKRLFQNSVLAERDVRLTVGGLALSTLGDDLALFALLLRVAASGGGAWSVALLLGAMALPTVLLINPAGRLVDRADSRHLTVACGLVQSAACVALAFATPLVLALLLLLVLQSANAVAQPAWSALLPRVAGEERTGQVVASWQAACTGARLAAPALAGLLVAWHGAALPLLLDGVTFLALAVAGASVRTRRHGGLQALADDSAVADVRSGFGVLRADRVLWTLFCGLLVFVLVGEGSNVVEVFLVTDSLGGDARAFGLVGAVFALGLVVGSAASGRASGDRARQVLTVVGAGGVGLAMVAAGLAPSLWLLGVTFVVLGLANGSLNAAMTSLVLTRTPEQARGRVVAALQGGMRAFSLGALVLAGLLASAVGGGAGPRVVFVTGGSLGVVVAVVIGVRLLRAAPAPSVGHAGHGDPVPAAPAGVLPSVVGSVD